jgi:hypothetical protein
MARRGHPIDAGLAIRQDIFSRFKDATSFRALIKRTFPVHSLSQQTMVKVLPNQHFSISYGFFPALSAIPA